MATFYICDTSQQASIVPKPCGAVSPSITDGAAGTVTLASRIASRPAMYLLRDVQPLKQYLQSFIMMGQWSARLQVSFPVPFLSTSEISSRNSLAGASVMFAEGERFELPKRFAACLVSSEVLSSTQPTFHVLS